MKYIMLQVSNGVKLPFIFPDALAHCFVAGALQLAMDTLDPKKDLRPKQLDCLLAEGDAPVISAGFVKLGIDTFVNGESESLGGLKSVPADAARMVIGESVQYMPDEIAEAMLAKLRERVAPKLDEGGGEAALAIGEHAFRAGFYSCLDMDAKWDDWEEAVARAWSAYEPSEEIKELS